MLPNTSHLSVSIILENSRKGSLRTYSFSALNCFRDHHVYTCANLLKVPVTCVGELDHVTMRLTQRYDIRMRESSIGFYRADRRELERASAKL
jgi:hypothetical protein